MEFSYVPSAGVIVDSGRPPRTFSTVQGFRSPMGWVIAALLLLPFSEPLPPEQLLPSRALPAAGVVVAGAEPASFDLIDWREERRRSAIVIPDSPPHSVFGFKRHVGFAA